jgi:Flp pilus assembly protein TadD
LPNIFKNSGMKKLLIIAVSTGISFMSWGQSVKSNIQSSINYLRDKDYDHALEYIEKAVKDPAGANDQKAWLTRGNIYMEMQSDAKYKSTSPYKEAAASFMKAVDIKSEFSDKENIGTDLLIFAYDYYNDGVKAFNERTPEKYTEAAGLMQKVVDIHDFEVNKKFAVSKKFDTISMEATHIIGTSYIYENKDNEAVAVLNTVKNSHMVSSVDIYVHLADIYKKEGKQDEELAIIKEGRTEFPKDESLRAMEINYYIKTGKVDVLVSKLEESVKEHPDNSELWFNLGTIYMNTANPKTGNPPANAADLTAKAVQAYNNAIKLDPENVDYNYNIGAMYYNQGVDLNDKMNAITGTSAAENKKYDELKKQRLALFTQAQPYLEKSLSVLDAKGDKMRKEDRNTYIATATSLREIYGKEDKPEKATEMTKKLQGGK